jgi:hypothetical protein
MVRLVRAISKGIQRVINPRSALVAGLIGGLTLLVVLSAVQAPSRPRIPSGSPDPGRSALTSASPPVDLPKSATYEDSAFGIGLIHDPTAESGQAKLWFNDGSWWATIVDPTTEDLRIARLDWATQQWQDTGTLVDERLGVRVDCVWDGTHLTIVAAGTRPTTGQAARLIRFHYDRAAHRYVVDPDFPITLVPTGVESPTIARDSKGVLWFSYIDGGSLLVRHSVGDDYHWAGEAPAAIPGLNGVAKQASLTSYGGRVALAWSLVDEDILHVAVHQDTEADGTWSSSSTEVTGLRYPNDGLALRAYEAPAGWRLFVAARTGQDPAVNSNSLASAVVLMILEPDDTWTNVQVSRAKDNLIHPVVALDVQNRLVYLVAATSNTGRIVYKRSPLDKVAFETGTGEPLVASTVDANINNPSTTKQNVDGVSGLVVLAADDTRGRYLHGTIAIGDLALAPARPFDSSAAGSPQPSTPSASPATSASPAPSASPAVVNTLAHVTFDPWAIGSSNPDGWVVESQGGGKGNLSIVAGPSANDHVLRVTGTSATGAVRACLSTPESISGLVTVMALVNLSGVGGADTTIASIRGPGGEAASVRVTRHGLLAYFDGATKVLTTTPLRKATWYLSTIVIDMTTQTYDWTLAPAGGKAILQVKGVHWRTATLAAVDSVCIQTAQDSPGQAVFLNDIIVEH